MGNGRAAGGGPSGQSMANGSGGWVPRTPGGDSRSRDLFQYEVRRRFCAVQGKAQGCNYHLYRAAIPIASTAGATIADALSDGGPAAASWTTDATFSLCTSSRAESQAEPIHAR